MSAQPPDTLHPRKKQRKEEKKMRHMKFWQGLRHKRSIAVLTIIMMILQLLPAAAFAEEETESVPDVSVSESYDTSNEVATGADSDNAVDGSSTDAEGNVVENGGNLSEETGGNAGEDSSIAIDDATRDSNTVEGTDDSKTDISNDEIGNENESSGSANLEEMPSDENNTNNENQPTETEQTPEDDKISEKINLAEDEKAELENIRDEQRLDEVTHLVQATASLIVQKPKTEMANMLYQTMLLNEETDSNLEPDTIILEAGEELRHRSSVCPECKGEGHPFSVCESCEGTGEVCMVSDEPCAECNGEGKYLTMDWDRLCPICNGANCKDNPNCYFGYELFEVTCTECQGTGHNVAISECASCEGKGIVYEAADCSACAGKGVIDCTGTFDEGTLIEVNENGVGTMSYLCSDCSTTCLRPLAAEETLQLQMEQLSIDFGAKKNYVDAADTIAYSLKIVNDNEVSVENITAVITLGEGLNYQDTQFPKTTFGSSSLANFNEETRELIITVAEIGAHEQLNITINATAEDAISVGSDLITSLSVTISGAGNIESIPMTLPQREVSVHINKYKTAKNIYLAGYQLGGWYDYNRHTEHSSATDLRGNSNSSLDALENAVFSFEQAFNKDVCPQTGYVDFDPYYYGEFVHGQFDPRLWQCVGFVPYMGNNAIGDMSTLRKYIFSENETIDGFQVGTLEDVKQFVAENGGVLYGEIANEENMLAFEKAISTSGWDKGTVSIVCVWYVSEATNVNKEDKWDYGDTLTIKPATIAADTPTSPGVDITFDYKGITQRDPKVIYDSYITVTIGKNAPNDVHVNLAETISKISDLMSAIPTKSPQPGDILRYHLTVVDKSGKKYNYVARSAEIGTVDCYNGEKDIVGSGFDGYQIPFPEDGFSVIPRRAYNYALAALGVPSNDVSDTAIGKKLYALGYGEENNNEDKELLDNDYAMITQKYLGRYYLDYFNCARRDSGNGETVTSFQDLTISELALLTNGRGGGAPSETCQEVAEGLYYFYYGQVYTFNGVSLYDHMVDNAMLDTEIAKSIEENEPYTLIQSAIAGLEANNGFQDTEFGFRMHFDMSVQPTPPTPGPDPDPTPTPDPGDGPDPDPEEPPTYTPPTTPTTPETTVPEPEVPLADLPEVDVPLADVPEETEEPLMELPEDEVPLADVPKTGDASFGWLAALLLSGLGLLKFGSKKCGEEK